eukprot:gnl/MRDRNA2_/MRDRNA2_84550_c0_seq2.p1 gnl/MRDRNA2_/MRDRNA2_84550_c0~~gnl/MRDRNA2_/MRDRNA2_84550_c0_seq2.p1  ORF type:complete len:348 (+),score=46.24 gnl/MRDRNA2_/MRDRNA2_84550_c0_seq2:85-1128(+)
MLLLALSIAFQLVVTALAGNLSSPTFGSCTECQDGVSLLQHSSVLHKYDRQANRTGVHEDLVISRERRNPTLFCWAFVMPNSYEVELLKEHLDNNLISGCDGWAIYSNVSFSQLLGNKSVGHSFSSDVISDPLPTNYGGKFNTSLNTPLFIQLWRHIFRQSYFSQYDWTIKVDLDTVFLPHRVRQLLLSNDHIERNAAIYLGNKDDATGSAAKAFTGAIEVLSRNAVKAYAEKPELCESGIDYANISEDWYLARCLNKLGVTSVPEPRLLSENANIINLCGTQQTAAYHSLKSVEDFRSCLKAVTLTDIGPAGDFHALAGRHKETKDERQGKRKEAGKDDAQRRTVL